VGSELCISDSLYASFGVWFDGIELGQEKVPEVKKQIICLLRKSSVRNGPAFFIIHHS